MSLYYRTDAALSSLSQVLREPFLAEVEIRCAFFEVNGKLEHNVQDNLKHEVDFKVMDDHKGDVLTNALDAVLGMNPFSIISPC